MKSYWQVEGLYLLFVVLWGWAETAETYLYLSYPIHFPFTQHRTAGNADFYFQLLFKAWIFYPCASDMLSEYIPSLTRNLKSIPSFLTFWNSLHSAYLIGISLNKPTFTWKKKTSRKL